MSWRINSTSLFPYKVDEIEKAQYTLLRERSSSALKFLVDGLERSHDSSFYIPLPNIWEGEEGMMEHVRPFPMPSVATDPFDSSKPRIRTQGNTSDNKEEALTVEHSADNAEKYQCNSKHIAFTSDDSFNSGQQLPSNAQLSSSQALVGEKESELKVESNDLILALSGAECKDTIHFPELPSNKLIPELAGTQFQDNHYLAGASSDLVPTQACSEHDDKKKIQSLMASSNYLIPALSSTTHSEKVKSDGNLHCVKRFPVTSSNAQEITQAEMLQTIMTIKEENIKTEKVELTKSAKAAKKLNSSEITQEGHFWIRLSFIKAEIIRSRKLMRRLSKKLKSKFRVEVMKSSQELDAVKQKLCELETTLQETILEKQGNWYADSYTLSPCEVKELEKKYEVKITRKIKPARDIIEVQRMMKSVINFYHKVARLKANVEKKFVCDGVSNVFADHAPTDCPKTKKSSKKKTKDVADGRYRQFLKRLSKKPNLPVGTNTGRSAKQIICESLHKKEKPSTDFMTSNTAPYPCETVLAPTSTTHSEMVRGDGSLLSVKRFPVTSSDAQEIPQAKMLQTVMTVKEENIKTEKVELTKSTKASEKLNSSEITQEGQFWIRLSFIKAEIIRSERCIGRFNKKLRSPKNVVKAMKSSQKFDDVKEKLCTLEIALQEAILEKQDNWYADSYTLSPCEVKELKTKYGVKVTKKIKPASDIIEVQRLIKAAKNYYHTIARLKARLEKEFVSDRVSNIVADHVPTDCPKTKKSMKKAKDRADKMNRQFLRRLFGKPYLPISANRGCAAKHIIHECLHTTEKPNTDFMTRNTTSYPCETVLAPTNTTHNEMFTGDGSLLSVKRYPVTSSNAQEITQAEMLQTVMTIKEGNIETEKVELTKSAKVEKKLNSSEITQEGHFWIRLSSIKAEIIRSTTSMRRFTNKLRKPKKVVKALEFSLDTMKEKLCRLETALQEAILEKQGNWYADSYTLSPCEVKELEKKYEVKVTKRIKPASDIIEVQSLMKAANNYYHTVARLKANVERKCVSDRVSNVLADHAPRDCPETRKSSKEKAMDVADNRYRQFLSRLFDKPNLPVSTNTGCSAKLIIRECLHTKEKLNTPFMTRNSAPCPHEIVDIETSSHGSSGIMVPPKTYLREIINVEASAQMNSSTEIEPICVSSSDDNDGDNFDIISISSGDDYTYDSAEDSGPVAVSNDRADTNLDMRIVICEPSKPSLTAWGSQDCNLQNEPDHTDILTKGSSKSSTISTRDDFHHLDGDDPHRNCTGINTETSTLSPLCTCSNATTYSKMCTCECSASASNPEVQSHSFLGSGVDLRHLLRRRDTIKSEVKHCLDVSTVSGVSCPQQFLENEKCHWDKLQDVYTAVLQSLKEAQNLVKSSLVRDQRCAKWVGQVSNQCMMKEFEARIQGFGHRFRELEVENQRERYCKEVSYRNLESGSKVKYKSLVKSLQHLKQRLDLLRRTFKSAKRNYSLTCEMLGQQGKMVLLQ